MVNWLGTLSAAWYGMVMELFVPLKYHAWPMTPSIPAAATRLLAWPVIPVEVTSLVVPFISQWPNRPVVGWQRADMEPAKKATIRGAIFIKVYLMLVIFKNTINGGYRGIVGF